MSQDPEDCYPANEGNGPDPSKLGYDQCEPSPNEGPYGPGAGPNGSYCDLDVENNVWVEGVVDLAANPPKRGICMLDTMQEHQVSYVLRHDPKARCDLPKVTSNPYLLALLGRVGLLSTGVRSDSEQRRHNTKQGSLPFYNQFGGKPPYKPGNSK